MSLFKIVKKLLFLFFIFFLYKLLIQLKLTAKYSVKLHSLEISEQKQYFPANMS